MHNNFPTEYSEILDKIQQIDPMLYSRSRNYLNGAVTYLSPYISRGVISTKQVWEVVKEKGFTIEQSEKFLQELTWREYFQRVWQHLEDDMFDDIRRNITGVTNRKLPAAILSANTGIEAIDKGINDLYETGYMHNHLRMYVASLACNIGKSYWDLPSRWMYYHLLDGDLASNTCSWQWVAGTFSSKQYVSNQENINKYTNSTQQNTFLDKPYEQLPPRETPEILTSLTSPVLVTILPDKKLPQIDSDLPTLIYTSYNLDPIWRSNIKANRILLLEPSHFKKYPVSSKVLQFILELGKNIDGLQIFVGEFSELSALLSSSTIYSKEHPAYKHISGIKDERDWIFPTIKGFNNSFFGFWKKCERELQREKKGHQCLSLA